MITVIAGSRSLGFEEMSEALRTHPWPITEVVSGCAAGIDSAVLMKPWACPVRKMPADWSKGRTAGHTRNKEMALVAHALIAVWNGYSPGTRNMIQTARRLGLKVAVWNASEPVPALFSTPFLRP